MLDTRFNLLPTMVGSLPHKDAARACQLIAKYLKDLPAWPQLPNRSPNEGMVPQFSQGFPGIFMRDGELRFDHEQDTHAALETLYTAYLENRIDSFPLSADFAAGLHELLSMRKIDPLAVKGQVTGPLTFGLAVRDNSGKSILYDDTLADAAAKLLRLKAAWQENELHHISKNTIIFVDEPAMASYGSAFFNLSREKVVTLVEEVLAGINGIRGVHCCGNTDWSVLLDTSAHIVNFDTYNYAGSLSLYPSEVKKLLDKGGAIAWGIVPNTEEYLLKETTSSLKDRLEEAMAPFTRKGISFKQLKEQGLLTPSCGLAGLSEEGAAKALEMLADLANKMRGRGT
jgi:methionine synthase II (cobalamin-independent)